MDRHAVFRFGFCLFIFHLTLGLVFAAVEVDDEPGLVRDKRLTDGGVLSNCTFDSNICDWKQDKADSDNYDWIRHKGTTPSDGTGPSYDHTSKTGYYMYIEATSKAEGTKARLISETLSAGVKCLRFFYHMRGSNMGTLNVKVRVETTDRIVFTVKNNQGTEWMSAVVDLTEPDPFQIVLEGIRGNGYAGDIAIDDVLISDERCPADVNCTFDTSLCGWTPDLARSVFPLKRQQGSTPTDGTGPRRDHTTGDGYYMYLEASDHVTGQRSSIISRKLDVSDMCFEFFYHMFGLHVGRLDVLVLDGTNNTQTVWSKNGSHANAWERARVNITATSFSKYIKIIFQMTKGSDYKGDIGIDDITVTPSSCPHDPTDDRFNCTFEESFCGWKPVVGTNSTWVRSGVQSSSSYPNVDHTKKTYRGRYMFVHPVGNSTARINSPKVTFSGTNCLQFYYYIIRTKAASVKVYVVQSSKEVLVGETSGTNGDIWKSAMFNISGAPPYQVVLEGLRAYNYTGRMGIYIDDITIVNKECPTVRATFNCTFDEGDCGWQHEDMSDDFDWRISRRGTGSSRTGPSADHTGGGAYIYVEASDYKWGNRTHLVSPEVLTQSTMCLEFFYHMKGEGIGSLNVYLRPAQNITSPIWSLHGYQGYNWQQAAVEIRGYSKYQVIFEGVVGRGFEGDISVDDITISEKQCQLVPATVNCTFDVNMCGWSGGQANGDKWKRVRTNMPDNTNDFIMSRNISHYLYSMDLGQPCKPDVFLTSPNVTLRGVHMCVRFFFKMYGQNLKSLDLSLVDSRGISNGTATYNGSSYTSYVPSRQIYWSNASSTYKNNKWHLAEVDFDWKPSYQMSLGATCQTIDSQPIVLMIDNVTFMEEQCIKPPPVYNCTFSSDICDWRQDKGSDTFDWTRQKGKTPSSDTGPDKDRTAAAGYYMYIEATSKSTGAKARLIADKVSKGPKCLEFYYHMLGKDIGSLNIIARSKTKSETTIWTKRGNLGKGWNAARVLLNETSTFELIFEGIRGKEYAGDIAIDDITITDRKKCPSVPMTFNCSFTEGSCGWSQIKQGDDMDWIMNHGGTPTSNTGPINDHTTGTGLYMYIETSSGKFGDSAQLLSPEVTKNGTSCMTFFYHMRGKTMGSLKVLTRLRDNRTNMVWTRSKGKTSYWRQGLAVINETGPFQVIIEASRGSGSEGDIAIDDIDINNGSCPEEQNAFNCSFDGTECGWQQEANNDNIDFVMQARGTPSSNTGPSTDHTGVLNPARSGVGMYLFIEASNAAKGARAHLKSPDQLTKGPQCVEFYYHMYGNHIGTLNVNISTNFINYNIWSLTGKQGNQWKRGLVEINETAPYNVIFEAVRGSDYDGDIAIDDVGMANRSCPDGTVAPTLPSPVVPRPNVDSNRCLQTYKNHAENGVLFTNPNLRYSNCSLSISVPTGNVIHLTVNWETHITSCQRTTLTVDEKDMTKRDTYCGYPRKFVIISKSDMLHLRYTSNFPLGNTPRGLTATWYALPEGSAPTNNSPVRSTRIPFIGVPYDAAGHRSWQLRVVGVVLFLILTAIIVVVLIVLLFRRKTACFARKSDSGGATIDMGDVDSGVSLFGGSSYSRLKESTSTGTLNSSEPAPDRASESVYEFKRWLHSQGVTETTYQILAKEGFKNPKLFALLKPEDVAGLPIKKYAQILLVKLIAQEFHRQDPADDQGNGLNHVPETDAMDQSLIGV